MASNFNDTTPAAPAGGVNVIWQSDGAGNDSGYVPASSTLQTELVLTAQSADVTSTNLVASAPANARYRLTVYIVVTTVDGASSTLPAVSVGWTDADNSTAISMAITATQAGNTLTTVASGTFLVNAKSGTAITVSTSGYASGTPTTMKFSLYAETELL